MKRVIVGMLALCALWAAPAAAQGTLPISLEGRLDAGIPVGDFGDSFSPGLGWGVQAIFDLTPTFAVLGGYSRFELPVKGAEDVKGRDDGVDLGARVLLGTGMWTPFVQLGVLLHDDTGFQAGLGADYPLGAGVAVTPLVSFRKLGDAQYLTAGVGLRLRP